ncbi:hypothetical protein, partial [Arthrobacter sp. JCM 19049]|uniref:hypothetical protein n=1 Tax=Arthrobacter sp. JCM 19049 TaxID=1460643 RepID=UPI00243734C9
MPTAATIPPPPTGSGLVGEHPGHLGPHGAQRCGVADEQIHPAVHQQGGQAPQRRLRRAVSAAFCTNWATAT